MQSCCVGSFSYWINANFLHSWDNCVHTIGMTQCWNVWVHPRWSKCLSPAPLHLSNSTWLLFFTVSCHSIPKLIRTILVTEIYSAHITLNVQIYSTNQRLGHNFVSKPLTGTVHIWILLLMIDQLLMINVFGGGVQSGTETSKICFWSLSTSTVNNSY